MDSNESRNKNQKIEIFRKEDYQCQTCGNSTPQVLLKVVDSRTYCKDCNLGIRNIRTFEQFTQDEKIKLILEHREQFGDMLKWKKELGLSEADEIQLVRDYAESLKPIPEATIFGSFDNMITKLIQNANSIPGLDIVDLLDSFALNTIDDIKNDTKPIVPIPKKKDLEELELKFHNAMEVLNNFKRTAFLPKVKSTDNTFSAESKFGGFPYLRSEDDWPVCPNCERNMQLFLQLELEKLPIKNQNGLLQMFYCTSFDPFCDSVLDGGSPYSKATRIRIIEVNGKSSVRLPNIEKIHGEMIIETWETKDDYPHWKDYENLGIDIDFNDELYELMIKRHAGLTISGDKLFGWPYWIQWTDDFMDAKTGIQRDYLVQLASEDNIPYSFGDCGIGYLTQDPNNKNDLCFYWVGS